MTTRQNFLIKVSICNRVQIISLKYELLFEQSLLALNAKSYPLPKFYGNNPWCVLLGSGSIRDFAAIRLNLIGRYLVGAGACFSRVPGTFRARKVSCQTAIRLF